jgi:hypothetical protein
MGLPSLDLRSVKDTSKGGNILHGKGIINDHALKYVGMTVRLATPEEIAQLNAGLATGKYGINVDPMAGWSPTKGYTLPEFQPKRGETGLPEWIMGNKFDNLSDIEKEAVLSGMQHDPSLQQRRGWCLCT